MPLRLESLSAEKLGLLSPAQTVFFFPVGGIEDHGPHLPLGLDLLEAEKLSELAAEKLEREMPGWMGVIMPRAPLALQTNTTQVALTVRAHVLRDWLVDACEGLARLGFCHFVCFSGSQTPKQLTAIEEAGKILRRKGRSLPGRKKSVPTLVSANSALVDASVVRASPLWPDPVEHGGERDTSVALWLNRELVQESFAGLPPKERAGGFLERAMSRVRRTRGGYWGSPSTASAEKGNAVMVSAVELVFPKLRAVWGGASANQKFRSWYSILPPNKSFFKVWFMFLIAVGLFAAYLYVGMMGI